MSSGNVINDDDITRNGRGGGKVVTLIVTAKPLIGKRYLRRRIMSTIKEMAEIQVELGGNHLGNKIRLVKAPPTLAARVERNRNNCKIIVVPITDKTGV